MVYADTIQKHYLNSSFKNSEKEEELEKEQ